MKIRSLINLGKIKKNDIVDAAINKSFNHAVAFDNDDLFWNFYSGQFEIIAEAEIRSDFSQNNRFNFKETFGQEIKLIEFK
ncbi:MAG TPA: hypothetical protein V6C58_24680 [Allocoleopsis sp.]